jgi:membrane-bound metal-dependent hydrolase YbcI (DUF457 family)
MNSRQHLTIGATAATAVLLGPLQAAWLGVMPWLGLWILRQSPRRRARVAFWLFLVASLGYGAEPRVLAGVLFSALALWGSVFPDIDHHAAPAGRWGMHGLWRSLTALARTVGGHRQWGRHRALTHSWMGLLAPTVVWLGVGAAARGALGPAWWWLATGWATGVLSHLLADSTTPSGVQWGVTTSRGRRRAR